nr:hypothetical protein GCM10010200_018880 [Actinomadura rugatobispora]
MWGGVPPRNKNFTGRTDLLERLREGIAGEVTAVVPHALHGMGGVGKTQMAVEYAHRYRGDYDLVWWVPSDQAFLVQSSLAALAPFLDLPSATATGIEDAAQAVLDALRRGEPYPRWLLIFDNADRPDELNTIIPRGPGHVLITSRDHRWEDIVDAVRIDVFTRDESLAFLTRRVPHAITEADADMLAESLGDLPLALEQAGALQAQTGMPVDEYLQLLDEHLSSLMAEGKPPEYPKSMTAAWALSVSTLEDKLPEAVELLRCCAFFGAEPIPRAVFSRTAEQLSPHLTGILRDPILLNRAIGELNRFALAKIDNPGRTIQVHRLVQALLRDSLDDEDQDRIRHHVHRLMVSAAPDDPTQPQNWPGYAALLPHVLAAGLPSCQDPDVHALALGFVQYLWLAGHHSSAVEYIDNFEGHWVALNGEDHLDVLDLRRQRANIVRALGRFTEAYELNQGTLAQMRRIGRTDEPFRDVQLQVVNSIGADLRGRGDFRGAFDHDQKSLEEHEAAYGPDDARVLRVVNNLALDFGLISDFRTARELHERSYAGVETGGAGIGATNVLTAWGGLARAVRLSGNYQEAVDLGEAAHSYGADVLSPEHLLTLRTGIDLAIAYRRTGEYEDSLALATETHDRCQRLFGSDHPDTLAVVVCLSNIHRSMNAIDAAYEMIQAALIRYASVYGEEHPYYHGCASNVAILHRVRGDLDEARRANEHALMGLEKALGRNHLYPLTVATNLASDLAARGDLRSAHELGTDTLGRLRALLGEDHPMTLACAANVASDLLADGLEGEGTVLYEDTLDRYTRALGPTHFDTLAATARHHLDCDFDPPPI